MNFQLFGGLFPNPKIANELYGSFQNVAYKGRHLAALGIRMLGSNDTEVVTFMNKTRKRQLFNAFGLCAGIDAVNHAYSSHNPRLAELPIDYELNWAFVLLMNCEAQDLWLEVLDACYGSDKSAWYESDVEDIRDDVKKHLDKINGFDHHKERVREVLRI